MKKVLLEEKHIKSEKLPISGVLACESVCIACALRTMTSDMDEYVLALKCY